MLLLSPLPPRPLREETDLLRLAAFPADCVGGGVAGRGSWIMVMSSRSSLRDSSPRGRFLVGLPVLLLDRETDALREGAADGGRERERMRSGTEDIFGEEMNREGVISLYFFI